MCLYTRTDSNLSSTLTRLCIILFVIIYISVCVRIITVSTWYKAEVRGKKDIEEGVYLPKDL